MSGVISDGAYLHFTPVDEGDVEGEREGQMSPIFSACFSIWFSKPPSLQKAVFIGILRLRGCSVFQSFFFSVFTNEIRLPVVQSITWSESL